MNNSYQILRWDTDFFGFVVAKIIPCRLEASELESILSLLKRQNVCLVYWACDPLDEESQKSAQLLGGFLVDKKITYVMNLGDAPKDCCEEVERYIEEYVESRPNGALEKLALQSGVYSRFKVDPKISNKKLECLYKLWILNSVNKKIADAVFVAKERGEPFGMVTVRKQNDYGHIGIIAVDGNMRRKHVGMNLVRVAQKWFVIQECKAAQVVTQKDNIAARRLYEKCGFNVEKTEYFYHFWI